MSDLADLSEPEADQPGLNVPFGRRVTLPGRGQTFIRESGDPTAPHTLLLVHGWMASAGLNWAPAFEPLAEEFRVIAVDLRGHGRGIRSRRRFRLEDCADDLAALINELGCGPVTVVGYSMGGIVSQLLWRRHPELVSGLVLCSTTRAFELGRREHYVIRTLMNYGAGSIRVGRYATVWYRAVGQVRAAAFHRDRPSTMRRWATAEIRRHDMRQVLEAGYAICQFDSRPWLGEVDVPTAVIVTTQDHAIPSDVQRDMADAIAGASVYEIEDDHTAFLHPVFPAVLVEACREVATRGAKRGKRSSGARSTRLRAVKTSDSPG